MTTFPSARLCRKSYYILSLLLLFVSQTRAQSSITGQPQSVIFCSMSVGTVPFSVTYTASDSEQWEYAPPGSNNFLPIPTGSNTWQTVYYGAQSTLTAGVGDSLSGYQFQCVIYLSGDSTVSNVVTAAFQTVLPTPVITNAVTTLCSGSRAVLMASDTIDMVIWYLDGTTVDTGQQYVIHGPGNYSITASNTYGCATVTSAPDSVTALPLPTVPVITGITQTDYGPCAPDTATLIAAAQPGCTYYWYIDDDAYPLGFTGDTAYTTVSGLVSVKVIGANGCASARTGDVSVSIPLTAAPTTFITSTASVCRGVQGVTYTINPDSAGTTYAWSYSGTGATITGDGTSVTIDFGAEATSGNLSVQDSGYSCPANITLTMPVQVDSIPGEPGLFINPDTLIDIGNAAPDYSYDYNIPSAGEDLDYEWSYSGLSQVQTYVDTAATLQFYNASGGGVLSVTASNECGVSPARSLSIQVLLPDTVVSFTARAEGNNVLLNWTTSEEINTGTFILSRSVDSVTWTQLTQVPFSGNLNGNAYSYVDRTPGNGINYYRLEGDPATGNDSTTEDTSVTMTIASPTVRVFPNPAVTSLNVLLNAGIFQDVDIIDELGNILLRAPVDVEASELSLPVSNLTGGMYFLHLTGTGGVRKTVMFMKAN